ncbi:MAG: TIGR03663 family protein [Verrucomicrobia bacterium]|nr:TIGR03663 family protein [Verrucomicrobiota bacterium]
MSPLMLRWLPLALIAFVALGLRTRDLATRPMHADEANQAVKTGELLDSGHYTYDPRDHHGPTLYYAAAALARLRGERSLAELTETTVRLVPAFFGTAAVILIAALVAGANLPATGSPRWPALAAALFLAVSPPAVYYSRYFVQETLLATFTLAAFVCGQRWWRTGLTRWAVAGGACVGLMQATKASAPLFLLAGVLSLWITRSGLRPATRRPGRDAVAALLAASATAAVLFSSFGTNPSGLRDALAAYVHAAQRFGTDAAPTGHEKPWWYYLRIFGWYREGGLLWYEAPFSLLAIGGMLAAFRGPSRFLRGVAVYAIATTLAFSLFAYKTPWHTVDLVPAFAILAAVALAALTQGRAGRLVAGVAATVVIATLLQQTWRSSFTRPADWRNPFAYVHSSADVLKYRPLAEAALARQPAGPIRIISEEYWPLPWYLRGLPNVGFWSTAPEECDGALIVASAAQAEAVRARLRRKYSETFLGLRPGFVCMIFTPEP